MIHAQRGVVTDNYVNPLRFGVLFLYTLITPENLWFPDVFRRYKKRTPDSDGLTAGSQKFSVFSNGIYLVIPWIDVYLSLDNSMIYMAWVSIFISESQNSTMLNYLMKDYCKTIFLNKHFLMEKSWLKAGSHLPKRIVLFAF